MIVKLAKNVAALIFLLFVVLMIAGPIMTAMN